MQVDLINVNSNADIVHCLNAESTSNFTDQWCVLSHGNSIVVCASNAGSEVPYHNRWSDWEAAGVLMSKGKAG